jgi:uncharacterized protein (DUF1778 family)
MANRQRQAKEKEKKEVHFTVWVTRDQEKMITRAALAEDEDKPSVWIRKLALRTARSVLGEKE